MPFLFEFVEAFSVELSNLSKRIEEKLFHEPHASLIQSRLYSEELVKLICKEEEIEEVYPLKHVERIHKLYRQNAIDEELYMKLEWIRKKGNKAAHDVTEVEVTDILKAHQFLFEISVWYMQVYVTYDFEAPRYKLPVPQGAGSLKGEDIDSFVKPYLDQKLDEIKEEMKRQLDNVKKEKESPLATISEVAPSKEEQYPAYLRFREYTLTIPGNLAEKNLSDLPLKGCRYLVSEITRVGMGSLSEITESLDRLHLQLNGVGPHTIEKFWSELKQMEGATLTEKHENSSKMKSVGISEEIAGVFDKHQFVLTNKSKKAVEFEHSINKEFVYLLPNKRLTIAVHPDTAQEHFKPEHEPSHSTAFRRFPKAMKNGKTPTNYGYSFKVDRIEDLQMILDTVGKGQKRMEN